jgi:hypothetical protein
MRARPLTLSILAIAAAAPALAQDAGLRAVERMFLERTAISAADKSCNLFTDGERLALKSGLYQSEGELLRANKSPAEITSLADEVRGHAKALGCDHPSVLEVAGTIRSSYRQFAKTGYLEYPAKNSMWAASRSKHDAWSVKQEDKKSGFIFGLRRDDPEKPESFQLAVAIPWREFPPTSVQLVMRDTAKMPEAWLGALFGGDIQMQPPPRAIARPEWAGKMVEWEDNVGTWFNIYYFSPSAITRLEMLDPRETVQVETTPHRKAKNQTSVKVVFEIGDFRAARAFAMIPTPPVSQLAVSASAALADKSGGH